MDIKAKKMIQRLLNVTQQNILPLTYESVRTGNKLFGAAILKKNDLSVVVAGTNRELENPLWHGEVYTIKKFYELPANERPDPKDCIFYSTHEPCPLCLSAITWGGYDVFYYLFSYMDTRDVFNMPHDLRILKEVFKCENGHYAKENYYWKGYSILEMIKHCDKASQQELQQQIQELKRSYDDLAQLYQQCKPDKGVPLN